MIGTAGEPRCFLGGDGRTITTVWPVRVDEVVKGSAGVGDQILIHTLGGRVVFQGGSFAELQVQETEPLKRNSKYALFLIPSRLSKPPSEAWPPSWPTDILGLTFGPYSAFELRDDGRVWPTLIKVSGNFGVATEYRGVEAAKFLAALRALK